MVRRIVLIAGLSTLALFVGGGQAGASVTIGQIGDASTSGSCLPGYDWLQPNVPSGNPYVVHGTGTITSWSTQSSGAALQQLTMKMWRPVSGTTYQAIGHAGPQTLTAGSINTFPASVRVQPADVLGFHTPSAVSTETQCVFPAAGAHYLDASSDLPDGGQGPFMDIAQNVSLNISAIFVPDNTFAVAKKSRNKHRGTASITFNLPNDGDLAGSGSGAKVSSGARPSKSVGAGTATLVVKARGKKKRRLDSTGKAKLNVSVTYTPTQGTSSTQSVKVKLIKR
jgi:hypothetical protein